MSTDAPPDQLRKPSVASLDLSRASHRSHVTLFPRRSPIITSYQHPIIQRIHHLRRRDVREQSGTYYIEGLRFVFQAVQHGATLEALVVCKPLLTHAYGQRLVRRQRQAGVPILQVSPRVMHQFALVDDPQGIGAVVRQRWEALAHVTPGE
jgi:TrmH family RNA methyltransferase